MTNRSQTVRLRRTSSFATDEALIRKVGDDVILSPRPSLDDIAKALGKGVRRDGGGCRSLTPKLHPSRLGGPGRRSIVVRAAPASQVAIRRTGLVSLHRARMVGLGRAPTVNTEDGDRRPLAQARERSRTVEIRCRLSAAGDFTLKRRCSIERVTIQVERHFISLFVGTHVALS